MTTIRQLIQTSPDRANELFAKLVDTSETAVRTREKLFSDLKEELELLAALEEQHLFPVLRKHKDLKDLVREAINDNKSTRKLLTELDHTPKDTEEFATRVAELRRVFQQHVRDEKKELLPAVLKALSDEEAEAVVERIEAGKAEIEEGKRAEAEGRRAQLRREREKAEAEQARLDEARRAEAAERRAEVRQQQEKAERVQQAAETVVNTAWTAPRAAQQAARATQEVVQTSVGSASAVVQRTTEASTVLARGLQQVSSECLDMVQERMQRNLDGINALVRSRTVPEFLQAQGLLVRSNMDMTLANSRRLAELSTGFVNTAKRTVERSTNPAA